MTLSNSYLSLVIVWLLCTCAESLSSHRDWRVRPTSPLLIQKQQLHLGFLLASHAMLLLPVASYASSSSPLLDTYSTHLVLADAGELPVASDEFTIDFMTDYLGMILTEEIYRGIPRIVVKGVKSLEAEAAPYADRIRGSVIVSIADQSVEGVKLDVLSSLVKDSPRPLQIRFRNPNMFFDLLSSSKSSSVISTVVKPATASSAAQMLTVEILEKPSLCLESRACPGDVLEILYTMRLGSSNGPVLSSSTTTEGLNFFFVLGASTPPDPFPLGWDYGLYGMCVGEKRRVTSPPVLGFGKKGDLGLKVPPDATVVYDVTLVSVNGIAGNDPAMGRSSKS